LILCWKIKTSSCRRKPVSISIFVTGALTVPTTPASQITVIPAKAGIQ
jgi:hypothetical protein